MICEYNISSTADTESTPTLRSDDIMNRLREERDEARQQVRDIIQRKEAQRLSIIEEGNGVLTIIQEGNGVARVLDCYKEDCK